MTQRFLIYPVLFAVALQLLQLLQADPRWYALQIVQLAAMVGASIGGLYFGGQFGWVIAAWGLFTVFVLAPRFLVRVAMRWQMTRPFRQTAWTWRLAAWFTGGGQGRVYRAYASALDLWSKGDATAAGLLLEQCAAASVPYTVRGEVRVFELSLLIAARQFPAAVQFYERVGDWNTLSSVTLARLLAARAYAETGDLERALRCLHYVALSPRTIGPLEAQLWAARVCVAAQGGDTAELERLLQERRGMPLAPPKGGLARFAAYWRGRCALVRGDRNEAVKQLARAFSLTHPGNKLWRDAIAGYLARAEAPPAADAAALVVPANTPGYVGGQLSLRLAEEQAAGWRALMYTGRPGPATLTLLAVLLAVFLADSLVFEGLWNHPLWMWGGNIPDAVRHGQWWRPITALFLHANWLHIGMNGAALWLFGSAVEKVMGRWRFLVIFFVAGSLGNLVSALWAHYDVSIGASGGAFGVIGAFAVATYQLKSPLYHGIRRQLLLFIGLMVAADFTISGLEPQVDNMAHLGGFAAGIALAALLYPRRRP